MIQAIIFDFFGVLVTESWFEFKEKYFGHETIKTDQASDLMDQANAGYLSDDEFARQLADMAGISVATVRNFLGRNAPNDALLTYIKEELRPHYTVGMLSNASGNWLRDMLSEDQLGLFDAIHLSYETGIAKPDARAYTMIANDLQVDAGTCIFVDDQERHCTGASEVGMHAIVYNNFGSLQRELETLLHTETP